jgi:hypothetical protein
MKPRVPALLSLTVLDKFKVPDREKDEVLTAISGPQGRHHGIMIEAREPGRFRLFLVLVAVAPTRQCI